MPPSAITEQTTVPLCVDLDGTLMKSDLVWESLVRLLKQNPFSSLQVPFWLLRGRAFLKDRIAERVEVDVTTLPYHEAVVRFIRAEHEAGRPVILATASDHKLAQRVAEHFGCFKEVLASDGKTNLRGRNKAERLVERFGERGFDYAGNSSVDLPVWERARQAILVTGSSKLQAAARNRSTVSQVFDAPCALWRSMVQALRPHQWVKNLIVLVPLLTAHELSDVGLLAKGLLAMIAFSVCASAVYVLNDLLDLETDRHHPTKRSRPFAAGDLPLSLGLIACPVLLAASAVLAWQLSWSFAAVLGVYLLLTTSYSWRIKEVPLLDVFFLAGLYTIRLVAGHEATGIPYSFWLLVFSMFIFLSLALVKRFVELDSARRQSQPQIKGRGYAAGDLELVSSLGSSSGYLAVLVTALYVNSQEVRELYQHPALLLLICPLLLYWISRMWMIAHRGQMHDDPIVFALKDRVSYLVGALTLGVVWLASGS